jgi:hypothetical protein
MKIWKCSRIKDEQDTVHIAKALVVLVDELTLRALLHSALLEMRAGLRLGPADVKAGVSSSAGFQDTP